MYRTYVALLSKFLRPDLDSFVTGLCSSFLGKTPQESSSNFIFCFVVNGNISEYRIREMFLERVVNLKDSKNNFIYKRLSQYWTTFLGYAFWKTDKSFKLSNHVRKYDYDHVISTKPTDEDNLKKVFEDLLMAPWKSYQSNWEVLVQYPFNRKSSSEIIVPGQSLVIFRFDHSLLDGISAINLFRMLFQSPFSMTKPVRNGKKLSAWHKIILWISLPFELSKSLPILLRGRCLGKRDPSKGWVYDVTKNIPVNAIKTIKQKQSIEFRSVVHSSINGGMTNQTKFVVDELPLKSPSPLDRLLATDAALKGYEGGMSSFASLYLSRIISMFPAAISRQFLPAMYYLGPSYFLTVIPCTTTREFIDNLEIVDVYIMAGFMVPIGMVITVWGINNKQRANFLATPCIFGMDNTPIAKLAADFVQELEELASLS
ncbi:unnamed protein product [Allacma fusca]|uniref:O-acyltransferase WSD1 C-terminal domain-containing protein n=1 Tax=Allacma fusca TaxID=39272 RepID=A0A8J2KHL9_9HEXA|nr:unnamed protein product [Allacma fusca]